MIASGATCDPAWARQSGPVTTPRPARFPFALDLPGTVLRTFGVAGPEDAVVELDDRLLSVRFGFWLLRTPTANLVDAEVSGPYSALKGLGVRLSLADRGVTFGSSTRRGVCLRFRRPVPAIEPLGLILHPGATVTVTDAEGLADAVRRAVAR